jgi:DNA-binding GntR family transcriptional regulator
MTPPTTYRTKTDLAVHILREQILTGELPPGHRIRPNEFAADFAMSPTPVREALRVLQADGLVRYRSHQEIVVVEHSPEEALEVYRLRSLLEPLATELGGSQLTESQLRALERFHDRLVSAADSGRRRSTGTINASWHWTIYEASGSPLVLDDASGCYGVAERTLGRGRRFCAAQDFSVVHFLGAEKNAFCRQCHTTSLNKNLGRQMAKATISRPRRTRVDLAPIESRPA